MLKELWIKNLALVEELRLDPGKGLVVLTGETGAGKSIILQAIHLLAGGRASAEWVRSGAEQATVEAFFEFDPAHAELLQLLHDAGVESPADDAAAELPGELIVKRIISAKGKSRFYLNGSMATAATVGGLVEHLVSVASQHDHQQLLQPRYHLECIDAAGNLLQQRQDFAALYDQWQEVKKRLQQLRAQEQDKEQRRDFLSFQCREIEEIAPEAGEDERLAEQRDRLKYADKLIDLGRKSYAALAEKISPPLAMVRKNLQEMAARDEGVNKLAEDVAGASFVLEDAQMEIIRYLDMLPNDATALDQVTARIDQLQKLKRKYGPTLEEVLAFARQARVELDTLENMEAALAELEAEAARLEAEVTAAAAELSAARRRVADDFAARAGAELSSLALEQSRFAVDLPAGELSRLTRLGWDKPEFVFSANPGEELRPLAKVASGGELSRLMLALKCVLARQDKVESVVFDEVDAGISGQAAESVARKIRQLAGHHQVVCITHLPQIAAGADDHYLVAKRQRDGRTITEIDQLPAPQRPAELARMLAGAAVTDKTMAYATELISRAEEDKKQLAVGQKREQQ
ncbi:DNA repair protein RecN [Desulfurivibrio dismutans]|uniref:DNA repair protein RecN n=1 Tax=Desulfurivibrio dismutans TaxID=1398908 RepID=UPI0023DBA9A5|nr:DNA repair protein RecN [Desulfurivibrio alkaliphilus]MDF1614955.1 DNA repair protein RecN [Desulfurivibrio alkaliphilus]